MLVISPANSRVTPSARVMGQAVGAGKVTIEDVASLVAGCELYKDILFRSP